jgi:hypothetical protein
LQKIQSWDKNYQYLLFAADPYETIGFKVRLLQSFSAETSELFANVHSLQSTYNLLFADTKHRD